MIKSCSHPYFYIKQPAQIVYFIQTYLSFLTIRSGYIKRQLYVKKAGRETDCGFSFPPALLYVYFSIL